MDKCPAAILLFAKPAFELETALAAFVDAESDVSYYDHPASAENRNRLLYRGVEFNVTTCDVPEDLGQYRAIFFAGDMSHIGSALSVDFGGNVADGARIAPVAKMLMAFSARLGAVLLAFGFAWVPSRLLSDPSYFIGAIDSYCHGGAFPVLSTIDLQLFDGALKTNGLAWFSGQEAELRGKGLSDAELIRRAIRIVHDIAVNGPVLVDQTVPDMEMGKYARLSPGQGGAVVSVRFGLDAELSLT